MSLVITGSVAYDYLMRYPGRFRDHILPENLDSLSLSFLADSMQRVRYTMRLLGVPAVVMATVGNDFSDYRTWLEEQGLPTDQIIEIPNELTATFFVSTDLEQNQIANFYAGAMNYARNYSLESRGLGKADFVVISPNDPVAMLNYAQECKHLGIPYAYDPSQQIARLSGDDLQESVPGAAYLLCNEYELAMVQSKTGWSLDEIRANVGMLVLTLGKKGSVLYTGDEAIPIPVAHLENMEDPTGAGDAYRGGFFAALMGGLPPAVCGKIGSLCSVYAMEHVGTTAHSFTINEFIARYTRIFGAEPSLQLLRQPTGGQPGGGKPTGGKSSVGQPTGV
jgi:adenosine kinase